MMGGMLESRLALTAFAHFALSQNNVRFYDMDTSLLGHRAIPYSGEFSSTDISWKLQRNPASAPISMKLF